MIEGGKLRRWEGGEKIEVEKVRRCFEFGSGNAEFGRAKDRR